MESSGESGFCTGSTIHRTSSPSLVPTSQMYQQPNNQLPPPPVPHSSSHSPHQYATLFSSVSSAVTEQQNALRAAAAFALRTPAMIHSQHRFHFSSNPNPSHILDHHQRPTLPHHYPFHLIQSPLRAPSDIGSPSPSTDGDSVIDLQSNEDASLSDDRKIMRGLQTHIHSGHLIESKNNNQFRCKEVENELTPNEGKKVRSGGKTVSHFSTPK